MYGNVDEDKIMKRQKVVSMANPNKLEEKGVKFSSLVSPDPCEKELQFL